VLGSQEEKSKGLQQSKAASGGSNDSPLESRLLFYLRARTKPQIELKLLRGGLGDDRKGRLLEVALELPLFQSSTCNTLTSREHTDGR
jgi:hypothetical protein